MYKIPTSYDYISKNTIIMKKIAGIVQVDKVEKIRQEILDMPDEDFMCQYNPYYIITPGREDTVWYKYQDVLLQDCKFSLHPSLIKFGIIASKRFHSSGMCGYKQKMKLMCTGAVHIGNCDFKFRLEDPYSTIVSKPINFGAAMIPEMMGRLLEVECIFNDAGVEITNIKAILPYDEKNRLAGYARHVG